MEDTGQKLTSKRNRHVGIWEDCEDSITCHPDRTIAHINYVNWQGSTGTLDTRRLRITGTAHKAIRAALLDECPDTAWEAIYD